MINKIFFYIVTFFIFIISCNQSSIIETNPIEQPVPPQSSTDLRFINPKTLDSAVISKAISKFQDYPDGFDYYDLAKVINNSNALPQGYFPGLWYSKINYTSVGNDGQPRELSGLMLYPYDITHPFKKYSVPIVCFDHATEPNRNFSPSRWSTFENPNNFSETMIAITMALNNQWCVIMPDYQGMGDDITEIHPFCNKELLGKAIADICAKTIAYLKSSQNNTNCTWNNQLFLIGYSEGGFATMSGVKELEARSVNITSAACLSGPYDLTGTMAPLILDPKPFPSPYFLPYMIIGYNAVKANGSSFSPSFVIKPEYLNGLLQTMDMNHSGEDINSKMAPTKVPRDVLSKEFIDSLNNPNSSQYLALYKNNTWLDWTPKTKMLVAHCLNDDCVPYGNYLTFKSKHSLSNIQYFELGETFKYLGSTHVSMAPWAFLQGATWIQGQVTK